MNDKYFQCTVFHHNRKESIKGILQNKIMETNNHNNNIPLGEASYMDQLMLLGFIKN